MREGTEALPYTKSLGNSNPIPPTAVAGRFGNDPITIISSVANKTIAKYGNISKLILCVGEMMSYIQPHKPKGTVRMDSPFFVMMIRH